MSAGAVSDYGADTPKPLALWLKIKDQEIKEIYVYPIGSTRFSEEAWPLPAPMPFTIHNREVHLEILVEDPILTDQAVTKIKAVFGAAVDVTKFSLHNIGLTIATMTLINHFSVKDVAVDTSTEGIEEDIENLGQLESLNINASCQAEGLLSVLKSKHLHFFEITLVDSECRNVLRSVIRQWQAGEREIRRWIIHYPIDWGLTACTFDRSTDNSILKRTTEWEGNGMCMATLKFHYRADNPDYEHVIAEADSTTDIPENQPAAEN